MPYSKPLSADSLSVMDSLGIFLEAGGALEGVGAFAGTDVLDVTE